MSKTTQPTDNTPSNEQTAEPANTPETAKPVDSAPASTADAGKEKQSPAGKPGAQSTASKQAPTQPAAGRNGSGSSKGLAALALLIALGSAGFNGWQWYQARQSAAEAPVPMALPDNNPLEAALHTLQQQQDSGDNRLTQLERDISILPRQDALEETRSVLRKMQATQQAFTLRFESAFGNTRQDWRLAEAEHLLRMASLRLSALQDLSSARHLIEAADQILLEQDDPAAYASRDALARALADIRALPALDRAGLFMRLGALQNQVGQLNQLLPGFDPADNTDNPGTDWRKWLDKASSYVRIDLNSSEEIRPLLANQEVTHIRLAISLGLEQAQWAALNGKQEVYQQAINQTLALLDSYFAADHQAASAMRTQLEELASAPVSQTMPDINPALLALQAYIQERTLERRAPEVQP